jgi:hypothetical protein
MAGLGVKIFRNGEVLSDDELNGYFMDQVVAIFANETARNNAFGDGITKPALAPGRFTYLVDEKKVQYYDGLAWVDSDQFVVGDGTITTAKLANPIVVNRVTLTPPASGATITVANTKTLTVSNTVSFSGTDGSSVNFGTGGSVSYATDLRDLQLKTIMEVSA